jgi:8-oxo-dGTP diphosphatase
MLKVNFHKLNTIEDNKLLFAVIMAKYNGQWVYVKHKERNTWEIPGGHREKNETINEDASRELFDNIPEDLTYPLIQPYLHKKIVEFTKE